MSSHVMCLRTLLKRTTSLLMGVTIPLMILICGLVLAQVLCRNLFDLGLPWADELARFFGISLVFLAIPSLMHHNKHIAMELVPDMLGPRAKVFLRVVNELMSFVFCGLVLWGLYKFLLRAAKFSTPSLKIPNLIYYTPVIIGLVFLALVILERLFSVHEQNEETGEAL